MAETVEVPNQNLPFDPVASMIAMGESMNAILARISPTGLIQTFTGAAAPSGWLLCNGQAVSRTAYKDLFTAIGTRYGAGDGSTTFNVPNAKGRTLVGLDAGQSEFDTLGKTGGAKTHTLTTGEIPAHNHTQDAHDHYIDGPTGGQLGGTNGAGSGGSGAGFSPWFGGGFGAQKAGVGKAQPAIQNTGGGGAHNNLQPYLVTNYIIKT